MSDETYKEMWEVLEPKYKEEIMQSNMLKREMNNNPGLTSEEAYERIKKKYLDEEIAVEYFGTMFKNSKEFMNDIKAYTSKGLKGLKEKFRLFFRGKAKPDNYKELLEMFDKGIKEADERAVKRLEAERKKEREKRIKEIEESLPTDEEETKKRIKYDKNGKPYVRNDYQIENFDLLTKKEIKETLMKELAKSQVGTYFLTTKDGYDFVLEYSEKVNGAKYSTVMEISNSKNTKNINSKKDASLKALSIVNVEDLVNTAEWVGYDLKESKGRIEVFESIIKVNGENKKIQILVKPLKTRMQIYDLIYDESFKYTKYKDKKEKESSYNPLLQQYGEVWRAQGDSYEDSLPYSYEDVKKRITKSDSEGNKLSPKQQEFFNDSVVRDDSGNLLVVYHGSRNEFTIFDRNKAGESNTEAKIGFW